MWSIKEICEMTNVTRRTLQEYENVNDGKKTIQLLTHKTDARGRWMYDEDDLNRLLLIQMFVNADYKRKDIKKIIDEYTLEEFKEEYDKVLKKIERKIHELDDLRVRFKFARERLDLPKEVLRGLERIPYDSVYKQKSPNQWIDETIKFMNMFDNDEDTHKYITFASTLDSITGLKNRLPSDKLVQSNVKINFETFVDLFQDDPDFTDYQKKDWVNSYADFLDEIFTPENIEVYDSLYGIGSVNFIFQSIEKYLNNLGYKRASDENSID